MVPSRQEACASSFGAIAEATGTTTGDSKPIHVHSLTIGKMRLELMREDSMLERIARLLMIYRVRLPRPRYCLVAPRGYHAYL